MFIKKEKFRNFEFNRLVFEVGSPAEDATSAPPKTEGHLNDSADVSADKIEAVEAAEAALSEADRAKITADAQGLSERVDVISPNVKVCLDRLNARGEELNLTELMNSIKPGIDLFSDIAGLTPDEQKEAVKAYLNQKIEGEVADISIKKRIIDDVVVSVFFEMDIKIDDGSRAEQKNKINKSYKLEPVRGAGNQFNLVLVQDDVLGKVIERSGGEIVTEESFGTSRRCDGSIDDFIKKLNSKDLFTESMMKTEAPVFTE